MTPMMSIALLHNQTSLTPGATCFLSIAGARHVTVRSSCLSTSIGEGVSAICRKKNQTPYSPRASCERTTLLAIFDTGIDVCRRLTRAEVDA